MKVPRKTDQLLAVALGGVRRQPKWERRSGLDRRSGTDRRTFVEGWLTDVPAERRSGRDRRVADRRQTSMVLPRRSS
jgi:hypothetical protein